MWKKLLVCALSLMAAAALLIPVSADEPDGTLYTGDTVQYIFSIDECDNVAGISGMMVYSADHLELAGEPEFLVSGQGLTNTNVPGCVRFSTMISGGVPFSGNDFFMVTLTVKKKCTLADAALSFECQEIFSHDMQMHPLSLMKARVNILATGTDDDTGSSSMSSEEDTDTDTDSGSTDGKTSSRAEYTSTVQSRPKSVNVSSTDLTGDDEDEEYFESEENFVSSRKRYISSTKPYKNPNPLTSSSAASSDTSSGETAESSRSAGPTPSAETDTTPQSKPVYYDPESNDTPSNAASVSAQTVSAQNSSRQTSTASPSDAASAVSSKKTGAIASVGTAGRIFIAAFCAVLIAAVGVLILSRTLKSSEE